MSSSNKLQVRQMLPILRPLLETTDNSLMAVTLVSLSFRENIRRKSGHEGTHEWTLPSVVSAQDPYSLGVTVLKNMLLKNVPATLSTQNDSDGTATVTMFILPYFSLDMF